MRLVTEPVAKQARRPVEATTCTEWLDCLAADGCDQDTFLHGVMELVKRAPDSGWELLALLDQYYRRNKISAEVFTGVKGHLQDLLIGTETGEFSIPPTATPRPVRAPPAPVSTDRAASPAISPTVVRVAPPPPPAPEPAATAAAAAAPTVEPLPRMVTAAKLRDTASHAASLPAPHAAHASSPPAPHAAPNSLVPGDVLRGRYKVTAVLGQGGMGTVFEAVDQFRLDRAAGEQKVAIKVLHTAVIQRPRLFAELRREFQHLQSLSHPNVVRVHEFDRDGDLAFFTMEYLSGALLSSVLATHETALSRSNAWCIIRDAGSAVAHAHSRGVVHGDLHPGNIFITDSGDLRVLDFGAAHPLRRAPWISEFEDSQQINVATPSYASCQLLEGETAEARDDIYAMACVVYVLLTGNHPFNGQSALKARTARFKPERPRGLANGQWQALRSGLQFERARQPTDMESWLRRLKIPAAAVHLPALPMLLAPTGPRRANGWAVPAAIGLAILAILGWVIAHPDAAALLKSRAGARLASTMQSVQRDTALDDRPAANDGRSAQPAADATSSPVPLPPTRAHARVKTAAAPTESGTPHAPASAPARAQDGIAATPTDGATASVAQAAAPAAPAVPAQAAPGITARLELGADTVDVPEGETTAFVTLRRSRSLRGDVTFNWWTESGTAKPGRDFAPVKTHVETLPDGRNSINLMIPVTQDPVAHEPRSFYVVIDEPSDNATLGQRTLTMVTIP